MKYNIKEQLDSFDINRPYSKKGRFGSIPSVPSLTASSEDNTNITLTWNSITSNNIGYNIYKTSSPHSQYGSITSIIDTSTTSFIDTDIIVNQKYYYFIRSYNNFGQSQLSNIVNYSITSLGNYSVYIQDYQLEKTFEEYQDESFEISFNVLISSLTPITASAIDNEVFILSLWSSPQEDTHEHPYYWFEELWTFSISYYNNESITGCNFHMESGIDFNPERYNFRKEISLTGTYPVRIVYDSNTKSISSYFNNELVGSGVYNEFYLGYKQIILGGNDYYIDQAVSPIKISNIDGLIKPNAFYNDINKSITCIDNSRIAVMSCNGFDFIQSTIMKQPMLNYTAITPPDNINRILFNENTNILTVDPISYTGDYSLSFNFTLTSLTLDNNIYLLSLPSVTDDPYNQYSNLSLLIYIERNNTYVYPDQLALYFETSTASSEYVNYRYGISLTGTYNIKIVNINDTLTGYINDQIIFIHNYNTQGGTGSFEYICFGRVSYATDNQPSIELATLSGLIEPQIFYNDSEKSITCVISDNINTIECSQFDLVQNTTTAQPIYNYVTPPSSQPLDILFISSSSTITATFTSATCTPDIYLVLYATEPITSNIRNIAYNPNDSVGNAIVLTSTTGNIVTATGLSGETSYYFNIYSGNQYEDTYVYKKDIPLSGLTATLNVITTPTSQPTNLLITNLSSSSISGIFDSATCNPTNYLVIMEKDLLRNGQFLIDPSVSSFNWTIGQYFEYHSGVIPYFSLDYSAENPHYISYITENTVSGIIYELLFDLKGSESYVVPIIDGISGSQIYVSTGDWKTYSFTATPTNDNFTISFKCDSGDPMYIKNIRLRTINRFSPTNNVTYNIGTITGYAMETKVLSNDNNTSFTSSDLIPYNLYYFSVYSYNVDSFLNKYYLTTNPLTGETTCTAATVITSLLFNAFDNGNESYIYSDGSWDAIVGETKAQFAMKIKSSALETGEAGNLFGLYATSGPEFMYLGLYYHSTDGGGYYFVGQIYNGNAGENLSWQSDKMSITAFENRDTFVCFQYDSTATGNDRLKCWVDNQWIPNNVSGTTTLFLTAGNILVGRFYNPTNDTWGFPFKGIIKDIAVKIGTLWTDEQLTSFAVGADYSDYVAYWPLHNNSLNGVSPTTVDLFGDDHEPSWISSASDILTKPSITSITQFDSDQYYLQDSSITSINCSCVPITGADSYTIQYADNENFNDSTVLTDLTSNSNFIICYNGNNYIRMKSVNSYMESYYSHKSGEGRIRFTTTNAFAINYPTPYEEIYIDSGDPNLYLEWPNYQNLDICEIQYRKHPSVDWISLTALQSQYFYGTSIPVTDGYYYLRMRGRDKYQSIWSDWSNIVEFNVILY